MGPWVVLLLLLACTTLTSSSALPCNFSSTQEALDVCERDYTDLYGAIASDLSPWKLEGISVELMRRAAHVYTIMGFQKGIVMGFQGGKAHVVAANVSGASGWLGHHANIMFTYMHVMLELEQLFDMPDLEFVIATGDKPQVLKQDRALAFWKGITGPSTGNSTQEGPGRMLHHTHHGRRSRRHGQVRRVGQAADSMHATGADEHDGSGRRRRRRQGQQHGSQGSGPHDQLAGASTKQGRVMARQSRQPIKSGGRRLIAQLPKERHIISGPKPQSVYLGIPPPVLRFCSSPGHADIRQPIFHFYTKKYSQRLLSLIPSINSDHPWEKRKEILFGRFSKYPRHVHPWVNETYRVGANGTNICKEQTKETMLCLVRNHMFQLADQYPELMDISAKHKVSLPSHAQYKYLAHLDGQGLSSRLDQLLPLGSLIFKEESGYTTYYHDILKPYVHYIPFWKEDPQDILAGLAWAKAHDEAAHKIALASQAFAQRYLSKRARTCYWFKLLTEYAKLLKYKPCSGGGALGVKWVPIREYFDTVAKLHEDGRRFKPTIEQ